MTTTTYFKNDGSRAEVIHWDEGYVSVVNLRSHIQQKGYATKLMEGICQALDEQGKVAVLTVQVNGKSGIRDNAVLEMFYNRFGFVRDADSNRFPIYMIRIPRDKYMPYNEKDSV